MPSLPNPDAPSSGTASPLPVDAPHRRLPLPGAVTVREVGLRDGLQSIRTVLATDLKIEWVRRAHAAGVREIEVGSFVPAQRLPQLADTADVLAYARTLPGLQANVLVPNLHGARRALELKADLMLVPLSASTAHSLANLRRTPAEAVADVARMRAERDASGSRTRLEAGVGTAFGCTLQGAVAPDDVLDLLRALLDAGADRVSVADTVGMADPVSVMRLLERARHIAGDRLCCAHFHDTRGLALANTFAALQVGIDRFDASLAGIGGCPHAPGASGNTATEDLVHLLETSGVATGIDLPALLGLRADLAQWLRGEQVHGAVAAAGLAVTYRPAAAAPPEQTAAPPERTAGSPAPAPAETALPLAGIRVVEFTHMVMGPTCGMILADLGAEVIKVEPPGGDRTRSLPGLGIGFFRAFNRNKKSVVLDLRDPDGAAAARALVATADVLIENFRPGLMDELGFGHDALAQEHPRLVYASHKGFLPGPYEHRTALDEVVQMMGGLAYMTGPEGRPLRAGTSVNDIMGGMFGAIGILAALRERERTGRGQLVQSALFENCAFLSSQHLQQFLMTGQPPPPMPSRVSAWSVYDVFALADGEQLFVAATSDRQFRTLCDVIGRPDLAHDASLATNALRVAERPRLLAELGRTMATLSRQTLAAGLEAAGLPYAPITRPDELADDPHLKDSGGLVPMQADDGSQTLTVLLPLSLGGRRLGVRRPLPAAGADGAALLPATMHA